MSVYKDPQFPSLYAQDEKTLRQFDKDLLTSLGDWSLSQKLLLMRGLNFDDNFDGRRVAVTSHATPGTEFSVAHTLGKVPIGYIVIGQAGAGSIYDGATASTKTTLYLKSDAAATSFRILVF